MARLVIGSFKHLGVAALAATLAACGGGSGGMSASEPTPPAPPAPVSSAPTLTLVGTPAQVSASGRLSELTLQGANVSADQTTKVRVLLPPGYDPNGTTRYPVIYLYHGGLDNQTAWTTPATKGDAERIVGDRPVIVVMPDGGIAGYYTNWYNNGAFGNPAWETYHMDQLIRYVDANYKTIPERWARATAGLSMGGGGLRYAARHPDLIGLTASFSGAFDLTNPAQGTRTVPQLAGVFGPYATQEVRHRASSGPDLAKNLSNTDIFLSSGDGQLPSGRVDGTESGLILSTFNTMKATLDMFRIPYMSTLYQGQGHTFTNWNQALADWLPVAMDRFTNPARRLPASPASFTFSTTDPTYQLYGWSVTIDRSALEFSTLDVTGSREFTVTGSGRATVLTAPLGPANRSFRATLTGLDSPAGNASLTLTSDTYGRVSVPIQFGPANPFQQYSPEAEAASTGPSPDTANVAFTVRGNASRFYRVKVVVVAN